MSRQQADSPKSEPEEITGETAADQAEAQPDAKLIELYDAVQRVGQERDELKDQLLRSMAEFQNFRNRTRQEHQQLRQNAAENLVRAILPVLDNFERTIAAHESGAPAEAVVDGVRAVERQLRSVLESQGVKRIVAIGQPFDPEHHEAIGTEHSEEHPDDTVMSEVEPGYKIADKVIRPARVRVAKKA